MTAAPREQWGSKLGFVLAAVGSAVGLGNMWRFSYYAAENGGAAFVILYLAMTLLIGLPVMLAELTVGRGSRKSPILALEHFGGSVWRPMGFMFVGAGFLILAYYSVIAGWTLRYAYISLFRGFEGDTAELFERVSGGWEPIAWHAAFMAATIVIVARGVKSGIEKAALVLMPVLFLTVCGLVVYASTLDGAGAGYAYYLKPDFREILSGTVLSEAAGQAFYSLSLGMGAMLTFASYLPRDSHLPRESVMIAFSDFGVAFLAGLMVFPMIFAYGLSGEVGASTIGALFITLPHAFQEMGGAAGRVVGILFFGALVVGAVTSAISLLEVVTASVIDSVSMRRSTAAILMGCIIAVLGVPAAMNVQILSLMDQVAEGIFLVVGAMGIAIFVGYFMRDPIGEVRKGAEKVRWFSLWRGLLRYVVPTVLLYVLWNRLQGVWETVQGMMGGVPGG